MGDDLPSDLDSDPADDFRLAAALARDAGRLAADMLRDGLVTHRKTSVSDVVSGADHAAEELVVGVLADRRPDDAVIGEEGSDRIGSSTSGRTWFVDPVDGTYNFLSGLPIWCCAIGLRDRHGIVLGAIYQPVGDELWLGGRGHPTTCNGVAVEPLADLSLAELSIASYLHPTTLPDDSARIPFLRAVQGAATVRMLGSGSVELAAVAGGRLGCALQLNALDWDWVPGAALVVGAGGESRMFAAHGHRWHATGNRQAVEELELRVRGVADLG